MSYLQKINQQNRNHFQNAKLFLQSKQIDINNLPSIAPKKPAEVHQSLKYQNQTSNVSSEQSTDFDIVSYLRARKHTNNRSSAQNSAQQTQNKSTIIQRNNQQNNFIKTLEEYSFSPNADQQNQNSLSFQYQQPLPLRTKNTTAIPKQKKQKLNPKLKPINRSDISHLATIDTVFKNNTTLRINYIKADNRQWQHRNKQEDYKLQYILSKFPRIREFKNNQKAIIKCGLEGHNIFVCMPTGGGKSLTFQMLTFLIKGVYLCVLPLISLIFDQQRQAKILGIQAYSLTANTNPTEVKSVYNKLYNFESNQKSIVIFCTPEKLNLSQNFSDILDMLYKKQYLKRVIIDEVHCVSTWGKQFRIEYENLSSIKKRFAKTPILALTATVTEVVKQDIISRLGIDNCYFFQSSFNRANLYYEVKPKGKNVLDEIQQILYKHKNKTGIIYCLSRKECEEVSLKLNQKGFKTAYYHADIPKDEKQYIQESWMNDKILVIIATVAFGMGINKPDVRFVIHHTMSKSLQNYYQESGRAGRDGEYAECILFYKKADKQSLLGMNLRNDFSTLANKQFSTKQLAQMIKYCQQKTICRRVLQLRYLGETDFSSKDCNKTCDNCKQSHHYIEYECINQGKLVIRTLMKIEQAKVSISKNQFISILRNKVEKSIRYKSDQMKRQGINFQQLSATFEGWKADELQILILQFISNDILTERLVQNTIVRNKKQSSIINLYLKCNLPRCQMFLDRVQTLPLPRRVHTQNYKEDEHDSEAEELQQQQSSLEEDSQEKYTDLTAQQRQQKNKKYRELLSAIFQDDNEYDLPP